MSQPQIVSCPGCGKRYSVPPGAAPGQFQCQDCSAVVAYGQAPAGAAHGAGPQGGKSAKKAGRAAAARRKVHERHADEEEGGRGGHRRGHAAAPREQQNALPYVMGFITLAILVAGTVFLLQKSKKPEPAPAVATAKKGTGAPVAGTGEQEEEESVPAERLPDRPAPSPSPSPSPSPTGGLKAEPRSAGGSGKAEKVALVDNPPEGGNYAKSEGELKMMLKKGREGILLTLDHLPDTPEDVRRAIDQDVALIASSSAGSEAIKAADRLGKVGRAAIPRVLSVAAKLDFSGFKDIRDARDQGVVAQSVDEVMRTITGYDKITALQYTPSGNLADFQRNAEEWYIWWFSTGYKRATFYKRAEEEPEESL